MSVLKSLCKAFGDTKLGKFSIKHAPQISIGVGVVLGAGALASTAYATKRTIDQLEDIKEEQAMQMNADNAKKARAEKEKHPDQPRPEYPIITKDDLVFTPKDVVVLSWKNYIVPAALGSGSLISFIAAYKFEHNKALVLAGMLSGSEARLVALEHEMVEKIGEKKTEEIKNKVVADQTVQTKQEAEDRHKDDITQQPCPDGKREFTEPITCYTFNAQPLALKLAFANANKIFSDYDELTFNDWLRAIEDATDAEMPRSWLGEDLVIKKLRPGDSIEDYIKVTWYGKSDFDGAGALYYCPGSWRYPDNYSDR